jgi:hypothetical protein
MSESLPIPIGDEIEVQTAGGSTFKLDLTDYVSLCRDLEKEHPDAPITVLSAIRKHILENVGVSITLGEADNLRDKLELAYARKKKLLADEWSAMRELPPTTVSTPSA